MDYGKVIFEGKEYEVKCEAWIDGHREKPNYNAYAERDGIKYLVTWNVLEEYLDLIDDITDESVLCDWDNADSVCEV